MRVLVVSYAYAPVYSACSVRWTCIAEEWAALGVDVDVITAWEPGLQRQEVVDGVRVLRCGGAFISGVRTRARTQWRTSGSPVWGVRALARRVVTKTYYGIWRKLYWPDHAAMWGLSAASCIRRRLLADRYDALVSVALPFTDHIAAHAALASVSRRQVSRPIWLADYGDPFSFLADTPPNNTRLWGWLNRWADARIIGGADAVVVPNAELRSLYVDNGVTGADRIHVVPHLAKTVNISRTHVGPQVQRDRTLSLCYAGAFAKGVRTPDHMLATLMGARDRLADTDVGIRLDVVGATNDCTASFDRYTQQIAEGGIVLHGVMSHDRALTVMGNADMLVNVGNETAFRQPSKLVEYMASGKPILNFATSATDSSVSMLADYPGALHVVRGTPEERQVADIADFVLDPPLIDESVVRGLLINHTPASVAKRYLTILG
jgi:hypothetical protein